MRVSKGRTGRATRYGWDDSKYKQQIAFVNMNYDAILINYNYFRFYKTVMQI